MARSVLAHEPVTEREEDAATARRDGAGSHLVSPENQCLPSNPLQVPVFAPAPQDHRSGSGMCADITYIPMPQGHAYLCAVMDWHSRYVLGWAVSNTMDAALCQRALERAKLTWHHEHGSDS